MKTCKSCKETKELVEFVKASKNKDGRLGTCKKCASAQLRARGGTVTPPSHKMCRACKVTKPIKEFSINNWNPDSHENNCRDCLYTRNRQYILQKEYNLTLEEHTALLDSQRNVCAICQRPAKNRVLSVDHCHTTGRVRGLLCWPCNRFLGYIDDDIETLQRIIVYLQGTK